MNEADLAIVIGARAVCQWDSSGTAWKNASRIINFNTDPQHAGHYNRTLPLIGDAKANLRLWIEYLTREGVKPAGESSEWLRAISAKKAEWEAFKAERYGCTGIDDPIRNGPVLTQPTAIKAACDFADSIGAVKYFDAGDVQANGFQIVEDAREGRTFSDTGASYMGFAASALLVNAMTDGAPYGIAFCGDGSFSMNPQILIDGVEHGVRGCIVVFDNRRMAAISGLQNAQYGIDYKTNDSVSVDYVAWASAVVGVKGIFGGTTLEEFKTALQKAYEHRGLSLIHVPVYSGSDELGGMGAFGDWNVGNWCERVQDEHHRIGL
jgi:3D-(3,5/4)-trihydroxycyclohexane-1,2-dione acylhydrolase (decyclizing)